MAELGIKRTVGPVTGASTAGGGLGAALSQILVHYIDSLSEVETAVTVVLTVVLALIGGYLIPPQGRDQWDEIMQDADGYWGEDAEAEALADELNAELLDDSGAHTAE